MDKLIEKIKELEENLKKEETNRQEMEGQLAKLIEEKNALFLNLVSISNSLQCLSRILLAPVCDTYQWCYLGRVGRGHWEQFLLAYDHQCMCHGTLCHGTHQTITIRSFSL